MRDIVPASPRSAGSRVLVVDDDDSNVALMKFVFSMRQVPVNSAVNGVQAL